MKKLCPLCTKQDGKQLSIAEFKALKEKTKPEKMYGKICKTCKELMKESVTFFCRKCPTTVMVDVEKVKKTVPDAKAGDIGYFSSCVKCSKDRKFHIES